jgi:hypothetical protein
MAALRHAQEALTKDDIVEQTAKSLSSRLEAVAKLWMGQKGACDRLSGILGITPPKGEKPDKAEDRRETSAKVAALVLANAFIFQEQLASTNLTVSPLRKLDKEDDILGSTAKHWKWIWQNVNYIPIFQLGERVLNELPAQHNTMIAVRALLTEAIDICAKQAALRHDLMGRIYHWLLHDAKYLGTYYTSVSAATLLLKLTVAAPWRQDFGNPLDLTEFKVADLACGTGTLLMATAQALSDVYISKRAETGRSLTPVDLQTLHRALMENVLHGYDVLPSAVHLTASTLAMLAPEVAFVRMNLYVMPLGIDDAQKTVSKKMRLGSLDFLAGAELKTQMALDYSHIETIQTSAASAAAVTARLPKLDLCVMNPPFVRSVGGNLLFGSFPDERGRLQTELKRRVKKIGASATAGLGSVFVALADLWLKPEGRLAFVLPAALVSGEAWADTRQLIASGYELETVVSSHDAESFNFSENTDLSEILFIARKLKPEEQPGRTTYISLWRNPRSIHEALDLADRILKIATPVAVEGLGITTISGPSGKLGEITSMPAAVGEQNWTGALFAQTELLRLYCALENGELRVPGQRSVIRVPICRLDTIGALGPDRKRIHEGFKVTTSGDWTPYPAFWGHESARVRTIEQVPNAGLLVWTESPRGPNYGPHLWERSGRILLVERLWPIAHRVLAVGFDNDVLGNTWWALKADLTRDQEKALLLWLNSSAALLLYFGRRVVTRSAWMQMKQPAWQSMPVLDVRGLSSQQLTELASQYDMLSRRSLEPLAHLKDDPVRLQIDAAISRVLGVPDVPFIRELLDREPGLSAADISPRSSFMEEEEDEDHDEQLALSPKDASSTTL